MASLKSWAVPWPEGPEPPPPGLLLELGHVLLKETPFTQGISCYLMWKDTPMPPFGPLWGLEMLQWGAGPRLDLPCPQHACAKANNKSFQRCKSPQPVTTAPPDPRRHEPGQVRLGLVGSSEQLDTTK